MAFDYSDMQETATELLTEFNQGVIKLIKVVDGTGPSYDPGDPTETEFDLVGTVRGVESKYVDNKLILESDLQVTVAVHATQVPEMSDKISIDGKIVDIVKIMPVPPAGVIVVNRIFVR